MPKWTPDQQAAIEARDTNLLLAAAAGSGKTTVLVERVAELLREGADVRSMLIVTFTRAAAASMRADLIKRLTALAETDPAFRRQAEYAEFASISTIHSFCTDLLRAQFQVAEVDPAFRIADSAEAGILKAKALEFAMNETYAAESDDHLALTFGRSPEEVSDLALRLHAFLMERPDPWGWLDDVISSLERGDDRFTSALVHAANRILRDAKSVAEYAYDLCLSCDKLDPYIKACESDLDLIESMTDMDYAALQSALKKPGWMRKPSVKGMKDDPDGALYDSLRDQMKKLVEKAAKSLPLELKGAIGDLPECAKELRGLQEIVLLLDEEYTRLKNDQSLLTFTDLERRTLMALSDDRVRQAVQEKYEYVFVDEYQDVSDVQDAILTRVARENALFAVGDVKQSIYRFRHAEPTLFMRKYQSYRRDDGGRLIVLNQNFRSRKTVLEYTNQVFSRAMRGGDSEIDYDEAACLYPGAKFEGVDPPVELHLIDKSDADAGLPEDDASLLITEMKDAETEALLAAKRIRALHGSMIYDAKKGGFRPLEWRDFVILTRTAREVAQQMLSILRREGIPAYADVSGGYLDVMEVQVALAFLRLTENRLRDPEWIAVLRSPCIGLSSADLARIRARFPEKEVSYAEAVQRYANLHEDELSDRLSALLLQFDHWRSIAPALPLSQLVYTILSESGFYSVCGALPGGSQRHANLDILCDRAAAYEASHAGGLTGFLAYIEDMHSASEDMGEAHILGENDDVVRVMTVHKSKGLEFPVVIGVLLGKSLSGGARGGMTLHRETGAGMKHMDRLLGACRDTLPRLAAAALADKEEAAEELRILYVMLTRAKDRLILIGSVKSPENAIERYKMSWRSPVTPTCYLDLLVPPVCGLPGGEELREGEVIEDENLPVIDLHMHSRLSLLTAEADEARDNVALLDEACGAEPDEAWLNAYEWRYPHEDAVLLPLKLTASGISRELIGPAQPPELIPRPSFLSEQAEGMTGAERGTATHAALQGLDLNALTGLSEDELHQAVVHQLNALTGQGRLTRAQRDAIWPATIVRFLTGEIGQRMLKAKVLHREWMFTLEMTTEDAISVPSNETLLVQGAVDLCFEEDGEWVLLDYKTDRADDIDALIGRYSPQLALYARALCEITGKPVKEVWLCLLTAGQAIRIE